MSWAADGSLLFSNSDRLLKLEASGKNQTQLLADPAALIYFFSSCGANYVVFSWFSHGGVSSSNVWRINADGSSPLKLTEGKSDIFPVCSPDQKWVYYFGVGRGIYRVPLDGSSKSEAIFSIPQGYISRGQMSVSPDGKTIATVIEQADQPNIRLHCLNSDCRVRREYSMPTIINGACSLLPMGSL